MATARLDIRLDERVKKQAEKASALLGLNSLTEYIVRLMDTDSIRVIKEYDGFTIGNDVFDGFLEACETASEPNECLRKASLDAEESGIR
jgi:uncharacterized protein (DUF1778 family)